MGYPWLRHGRGCGTSVSDTLPAVAARLPLLGMYHTLSHTSCRLMRRAWRQFPSASAWVTVGFASLLLYLTVARKCTDGEYPEFCRLVHMQSNVDWV